MVCYTSALDRTQVMEGGRELVVGTVRSGVGERGVEREAERERERAVEMDGVRECVRAPQRKQKLQSKTQTSHAGSSYL